MRDGCSDLDYEFYHLSRHLFLIFGIFFMHWNLFELLIAFYLHVNELKRMSNVIQFMPTMASITLAHFLYHWSVPILYCSVHFTFYLDFHIKIFHWWPFFCDLMPHFSTYNYTTYWLGSSKLVYRSRCLRCWTTISNCFPPKLLHFNWHPTHFCMDVGNLAA